MFQRELPSACDEELAKTIIISKKLKVFAELMFCLMQMFLFFLDKDLFPRSDSGLDNMCKEQDFTVDCNALC